MNKKQGKIFILDDDIFIVDLYRNLFEGEGFEVFATTNVYQFIKYVKEIVPKVIILDINMPELNGWQVLDMIKKEKSLSGVPVVMLTVSSDTEKAKEKGVAHFINKPAEPEQMLEIVKGYF